MRVIYSPRYTIFILILPVTKLRNREINYPNRLGTKVINLEFKSRDHLHNIGLDWKGPVKTFSLTSLYNGEKPGS